MFIKFDEHGDYKMLFIYLRTTMPMILIYTILAQFILSVTRV